LWLMYIKHLDFYRKKDQVATIGQRISANIYNYRRGS
jgi:hypothetical protein